MNLNCSDSLWEILIFLGKSFFFLSGQGLYEYFISSKIETVQATSLKEFAYRWSEIKDCFMFSLSLLSFSSSLVLASKSTAILPSIQTYWPYVFQIFFSSNVPHFGVKHFSSTFQFHNSHDNWNAFNRHCHAPVCS